MTIRGRFGFGTTLPVFGFLHKDDNARDQSPFLPSVHLTANRDKSNGKLNPTISSPSRTDFQKTRRTNSERFMRPRIVCAGKNSTGGSVFGLFLYRPKSFKSLWTTSSL